MGLSHGGQLAVGDGGRRRCSAPSTGVAYYFLTQDTPEGNYRELRAAGKHAAVKRPRAHLRKPAATAACGRLFLIYGACFGMELTIDNIAVLYFLDYFDYFKQLDQAAGAAEPPG